MAKTCLIVPVEKHHLNLLLANMRQKDQEECKAAGMSPGRALRRTVRCSIYARTGFVDGELAAMWGMCGEMIGMIGRPWMLTTPVVESCRFTFTHTAKREIEKMLNVKPVLTNYVWDDYKTAIRFFEIIGFRVSKPEPIGRCGALFRQILIARM